MTRNVATDIAVGLKSAGVEEFFLLTGGDKPLWITLREAGIRMVVARSEASAVYIADGYDTRSASKLGSWPPNIAASCSCAVRNGDTSVCSGALLIQDTRTRAIDETAEAYDISIGIGAAFEPALALPNQETDTSLLEEFAAVAAS